MPRRFDDTCMQAGYTAFEFGEGVENNYFMMPANRDLWEKGWRAADREGAVTMEYQHRRARHAAKLREAGTPAKPTTPRKRRSDHPSGW